MRNYRQRSIAATLLILFVTLTAGGCVCSGGLCDHLFAKPCKPRGSIPAGPNHGFRTTVWRAWENGPMAEREACMQIEPQAAPELEPPAEPVEQVSPGEQIKKESPAETVKKAVPAAPIEPDSIPAEVELPKPRVLSPPPREPAPLPPEPQTGTKPDPFEEDTSAVKSSHGAALTTSAVQRLRQNVHRRDFPNSSSPPAVAVEAARDPCLTTLRQWLRSGSGMPLQNETPSDTGVRVLASPWPRRLPLADEAQMIRGVSFEDVAAGR